MEISVEGSAIDPAELLKPDWQQIRHKIKNLSRQPAARNEPVKGRRPPQQRRRPRPPESPLPDDDVKIILRPQGGLDLHTIPAATLADYVLMQAGGELPNEDQVRIHHKSNFIIVSTPSEERAHKYLSMTQLQLPNGTYTLCNHIPPPSDTAVGIIFTVPENDTPQEIMRSLTAYNHDLHILDAKRLRNSTLVQVLFQGPHVPFWVRYRAATLRCHPFKRKSEACFNCWQPGHRKDVCPNQPPTQRCAACGLAQAPEQHLCKPNCILCGEAHPTGAAGCRRRFQPRRRQPHTKSETPKVPTNSQQSGTNQGNPPQTEGNRSHKHTKPPEKTTEEKQLPPLGQQRTYTQVLQGTTGTATTAAPEKASTQGLFAPKFTPPPLHTPSPTSQDSKLDLILKEMQNMRADIALLRSENAQLRAENSNLKAQIAKLTTSTAAETEPTPPPLKRKNTRKPATNPKSDDNMGNVDMQELKQELLQSLNATIKESITALRAELFGSLTNVKAPESNPTDQASTIAVPIDIEQDADF